MACRRLFLGFVLVVSVAPLSLATRAQDAHSSEVPTRTSAFADFEETKHLLLGTLYFHEQRYPEAIGEYEQALKTNPHEASIHYHLARIWRRAGDKARADEELGTFERLRLQQQDQSNQQRSGIKMFVYTLRSTNNSGNPR